jgi:hypothetical protein
MWKKLAYATALVGLVSIATAVGCGDSGTTGKPDFSTNGDLAGADLSSDMNVTNKMYMAATPHDIDTATIGSPLATTGAPVSLTGLIVLAPPNGFASNSKKDCTYEVWAQDPACSTPPCGILIKTVGITNPNGTGMFCPYANTTTTALKSVWTGDKIDVQGVTDSFANTAPPPGTGTVKEHSVTIDTLTTTATKQALPNPTVVTDAATSLFVPYSGTGWAQYEGTLISLKPASGKFTTTLDSFGGWTCAPGGAQFIDTYTGFFKPDGGVTNMWPPTGSMFSAIDGIVAMTFGGGIMPTDPSDFHP